MQRHPYCSMGPVMIDHEAVSDFLITGCAVAPVVALCADCPVFALFSHIVLLFTGLALAGCDHDAPFKHPERFDGDRRSR
jgi:hypothetical protein